jgi:hypothetical protein
MTCLSTKKSYFNTPSAVSKLEWRSMLEGWNVGCREQAGLRQAAIVRALADGRTPSESYFIVWLHAMAVHEAGHAVVAHWLEAPGAHDVSIRWAIIEAAGRTRPGQIPLTAATPTSDELGAQKRVIYILAARAAAEIYYGALGLPDWDNYTNDEWYVQQISTVLGISAEKFSRWREVRLSQAREIVRLPRVHAAISRVAKELAETYRPRTKDVATDEYRLSHGWGQLSGARVKAILCECEGVRGSVCLPFASWAQQLPAYEEIIAAVKQVTAMSSSAMA